MPSTISLGSKLIRINPAKNKIELSATGGRTWMEKYTASNCGTFIDLLAFEGGIIALKLSYS